MNQSRAHGYLQKADDSLMNVYDYLSMIRDPYFPDAIRIMVNGLREWILDGMGSEQKSQALPDDPKLAAVLSDSELITALRTAVDGINNTLGILRAAGFDVTIAANSENSGPHLYMSVALPLRFTISKVSKTTVFDVNKEDSHD
jgi:hypothetical protein